MALLEAHDLRARYDEVEALHGIDLSLEEGGIVALLGANGAGKSTTLRALTGAIRRTGSVRFAGRSIARASPEDLARLGVAHVPEGRGTLGALTVRENLALGAYTRRAAATREAYRKVCGYFPWLEERGGQLAGTLSGGEQQMLAIARALMMRPRAMLLDEPSLGLAPRIAARIFETLRTINAEEGMTMLLAEQNAVAALALAGHAYVLETGSVALSGPARELAAADSVRRSYLGY